MNKLIRISYRSMPKTVGELAALLAQYPDEKPIIIMGNEGDTRSPLIYEWLKNGSDSKLPLEIKY